MISPEDTSEANEQTKEGGAKKSRSVSQLLFRASLNHSHVALAAVMGAHRLEVSAYIARLRVKDLNFFFR